MVQFEQIFNHFPHKMENVALALDSHAQSVGHQALGSLYFQCCHCHEQVIQSSHFMDSWVIFSDSGLIYISIWIKLCIFNRLFSIF